MRKQTVEQLAYDAGHDAALRGPNEMNCNFRLFATRELTAAWERGNRAGLKAKKNLKGKP